MRESDRLVLAAVQGIAWALLFVLGALYGLKFEGHGPVGDVLRLLVLPAAAATLLVRWAFRRGRHGGAR